MSGQGDLQELLRMFTSRKVPMITAMKGVQALQAKDLKTIKSIAEAPLTALQAALNDAKLAKGIHTACKSHGKSGQKRAGDALTSPSAKKSKFEIHKHDLDYSSLSANNLETSLKLPLVDDADIIGRTKLVTNRAPLVLAFAVELLRFTMPEQPPSSRLSLAQALVSANSRSKAISLGIEKPLPGGEPQVSDGQPKVRVMGREIPVLKRGDYSWTETSEAQASSSTTLQANSQEYLNLGEQNWTASRTVTSNKSSFIAHAAPLRSASARPELMKTLMIRKPDLETATHNAWAVRTKFGNSPLVQEASFDDGEQGCGKFLLQLMREANVTNTVVVLTRWWGGVMLGPDRWRIMKECVGDAISSQNRVSNLSGEALWGLDMEDKKVATSTLGMGIHRPEAARNYLLRAFTTATVSDGSSEGKKSTAAAMNEEKQENLGKLLGALRLLFESWSGTLSKTELDSRAWSWYVKVRPDVDHGPSGWGAKGTLDLERILDLRRNEAKG